MITIPASGLDVAEAHSLTTPHAAQKVHAPDHPQRDAPVSSCCSACIRGTRSLGYRPCGRNWACNCHAKRPGRFVALIDDLPYALTARSITHARVVARERWGKWPTRVERVHDNTAHLGSGVLI